MAEGHVNRTVLSSYYQNPGDIYDDAKTEGAYEVLAQQIDDNYDAYDAHKTAAVLAHPDGSVTTAKIKDGAVTAAKLDPSIVVGTPAGLVQANLDAHKASSTPHTVLRGVNRFGFVSSGTLIEISNGAITVTSSYHVVDTEGQASSDELTTITGGQIGDILFLRQANSARDITIKHGVGNIFTFDGTDIVLGNSFSAVVLLNTGGTSWTVLGIQGVKRSEVGSAAFEDYEEGTWTPSLVGNTTPGNHSYSTRVGRFKRIGKMVTVSGFVTLSSKDNNMAGSVRISGLPFPSSSTASVWASVSLGAVNGITLDSGRTQIAALISNSSSEIQLKQLGSNLVNADISAANVGNNAAIVFSATYYVD